MKAMSNLALLAIVVLPGCEGSMDWMRGAPPATAVAAPLASDTTATTRRVWSAGSDTTVSITLSLAAIMPSGAEMVVTDWNTGDPGIFDLASREFRRVRLNDEPFDTGTSLFAAASPDGNLVAFEWQSFEPDEKQLRVLDAATGEVQTIMRVDPPVTGSIIPVAWAPAGDSVFALLWSGRGAAGEKQVVLLPASGGTPRLVHGFPRDADVRGYMRLSPDGRWLIYAQELSRRSGRSDIFIIDVQAGGTRPLIRDPGVDLLLGWLPGTDIVLFSSDRLGTTDLWAVRVANGRTSSEPRLVRSGFYRSEALGFADGALFYRVETGARGPAMVHVDPQSGALLGPALPPLVDFATSHRRLAWSPDGQTLAVGTSRGGLHTITLHSMETGEGRVFTLDEEAHPLTFQWAADGRALVVRVGDGPMGASGPGYFLRLDLITGTTTRLFAAEVEEPFSRFVVTPDGRSIVLRQQRPLDHEGTESRLVLRSLDDGSERELHRTSAFIPEFGISADGTQLAFMQQVGESSDSLFVLQMDGSRAPRAIVGWDHGVDDAVTLLGWLPAGNALLGARLTAPLTSSRGLERPDEEIVRIDLDGAVTVVGISPFQPARGSRTVPGQHRSRLVLAPAGNRLAHMVHDSGEELWRMDGLHELFAAEASGRR